MANIEKLTNQAKELLEKDEQIIASVAGSYETKIGNSDTVRDAVLLATSLRVFLYSKKMFGYESEVFPYSTISSIDVGKGLLGHKVTLFAASNKACLKWIQQGDIDKFVNHVKSQIGKIDTANQQSQSSIDIVSQIKQLAELKEQGILTEDEFQAKKVELLAKM
jgi:hypothetical protein